MEEILQHFQALLVHVISNQSKDRKRSDITRLACALFESQAFEHQNMSTNEVIDKAIYLYERIESTITKGE